MAQPPPQYAYAPPPAELPYYQALFTAADKQHAGALSGPAAVEFLSLSKLPVELLKQIWTMADQPQSNTLDAPKFYVAVRLIQLFQNGKKPVDLALNLAEGEGAMRPPFFEGVDVRAAMAATGQPPAPLGGVPLQQPSPQLQPQMQPSPQLQPSPQPSPPQMAQPPVTMNGVPPPQLVQPPLQGGSSTAMTVQDPYMMTPAELTRYEALFPTYAVPDDPNNPASPKFVNGAAAVELFSKSGMDRESLKIVWTMCDDPIDNKLDAIEFSVAMHLIVCVTKKGLPMPQGALPASLKGLVNEVRAKQQLQQQPEMPQGGMQVPPSPGGIPSPDKMPQMGIQQPQMNGMPQMMGQPQMQGGMPPPQMGQVQQGMQQMGLQPVGSFGAVGGETVDDAFAGMSNAPVEDVDEYSTLGGQDASVAGGMSAAGGFGRQAAVGTMGAVQPATVEEVATPAVSPQPVAPPVQATTTIPPPPMPVQQASPRLAPRSPRIASPRAAAKSIPASEESTAELASLREAHQKLQAEVISLRAKAAAVGEEEMENQKEIAQLAGEIGKLSIELSELKETVMQGKVKLAESVGILKVQMEKKECLQAQVVEAREVHEALTSANEAVSEANDLAVAQQARAVAAAAAAKEEEAESVIPPPQPQPVETADLFSWDAPAPAPVAAMGAPQPETESVQPAWSAESAPSVQEPAPAPWGASDTSVAPSVQSNAGASAPPTYGMDPAAAPAGMGTQAVPPSPGKAEYDNYSVYSQGAANPNPYAGFGGMGAMGAPMGGATPMGGGDMYGGAMGGAPAPPQPVSAFTPPRDSFASVGSAPAPQQQQQQQPPSPSKAELEAAKAETAKAERSFRETADLVRSISTEVNKLESVAKKAETDMKAMEEKTHKKGSFVGGKKKKAKKEYEKAMEVAQAERKKVQEAREQLKAAERESENAKKALEERRQKYEQMELEAATAASYAHAQPSDSQSVAGQSVANQYADPFGGMSHAPPAQPAANDPYGMGFMGGAPGGSGGYENPFL